MNWLELWAKIQIIGFAIPFVMIGLIIIYEIFIAVVKKIKGEE